MAGPHGKRRVGAPRWHVGAMPTSDSFFDGAAEDLWAEAQRTASNPTVLDLFTRAYHALHDPAERERLEHVRPLIREIAADGTVSDGDDDFYGNKTIPSVFGPKSRAPLVLQQLHRDTHDLLIGGF